MELDYKNGFYIDFTSFNGVEIVKRISCFEKRIMCFSECHEVEFEDYTPDIFQGETVEDVFLKEIGLLHVFFEFTLADNVLIIIFRYNSKERVLST